MILFVMLKCCVNHFASLFAMALMKMSSIKTEQINSAMEMRTIDELCHAFFIDIKKKLNSGNSQKL